MIVNDLLISVIVPVYKAEAYICQCVDSILSQTLKEFELILVDDGSPDNSGHICDLYMHKDSRIKVIHKQNGGVSSARNSGIEIAAGKWLCFVDSDDVLLPSYLEDFELNKEESEIYLQGYVKKRGDYLVERHNFEGCSSSDFFSIISYAENNSLINSPCFKLFSVSVVKRNNILFDTNTSYGEDHLFTLAYINNISTAHFSKGEGYIYRMNDTDSLTQRVVPFKEITYYSIEAKRLHDLICLKDYSNVLLPSVGLTYITNFIRTLKYLSKANVCFKDFKWVRDSFLQGMKDVSTKIMPLSYKVLRLLTVSPFYFIIYYFYIKTHRGQ